MRYPSPSWSKGFSAQPDKLDKLGQITFANPPPSKIETLKTQGKILTYEQLNLPQRQQAKALESATQRMMTHLDQVMVLAKQIQKKEEKAPARLHAVTADKPISASDIPIELLFGHRLKAIRKEFGYSQEKVGELAGLNSASTVMNHYEKGRHQPSIQTIKCIADVFSVPVAYFFAETDELAEKIRAYR